MTSETKALTEFTFAIPLTEENETLLENLGFERRSEYCTYTHNWFVVVPLKKWYYPDEYYWGIKLKVAEEVVKKYNLVVDHPKEGRFVHPDLPVAPPVTLTHKGVGEGDAGLSNSEEL